jgi:hypothetical protein
MMQATGHRTRRKQPKTLHLESNVRYPYLTFIIECKGFMGAKRCSRGGDPPQTGQNQAQKGQNEGFLPEAYT